MNNRNTYAKRNIVKGKHVDDRNSDEFLGLVKGIIADGAIMESEVTFLKNWIESKHMEDTFPAENIYKVIVKAKGNYDASFELELLSLLVDTVGIKTNNNPFENSIQQVLTTPKPKIKFKNKKFVITGTCKEINPKTGKRYQHSDIKSLIESLGGNVTPSPSSITDYLVVCSFSSNNWMHSNYGRKIEETLAFDTSINIVTDLHLLEVVTNEY